MTRVVGIDPGIHGALAFVIDGVIRWIDDMPVLAGRVDTDSLTHVISACGAVDRVVLEQVATRPAQNAVATLTTGVNWGIIVGVVGALERPLSLVTPAVWVRDLGLPRGGPTPAGRRAAKEARRLRCKQMWPASAELFSRVKDDGRADAALIAHWGRSKT